MTSPLTSARFAIVPIIADSAGREVVPPNAIMVGSQNAVMERVLDSQARNDAVSLVHDAAKALGTIESIEEREQAVAKKEDAVNSTHRSQMMQDFIAKLDDLADRIDQLEREQAKLAHDPDDDLLPSPPSPSAGDDGDLQSPKAAPDDGELGSPIPVPAIEKFQAGPRNPVSVEDA